MSLEMSTVRSVILQCLFSETRESKNILLLNWPLKLNLIYWQDWVKKYLIYKGKERKTSVTLKKADSPIHISIFFLILSKFLLICSAPLKNKKIKENTIIIEIQRWKGELYFLTFKYLRHFPLFFFLLEIIIKFKSRYKQLTKFYDYISS